MDQISSAVPVPPRIRLVSTDFDGTLIEHDGPAPFAPALVETLREWRRQGVVWVINTGRTPQALDDGLSQFGLPLTPDYAITCEREVYRPETAAGGGWQAFGPWNARCLRDHEELFERSPPVMERIVAYVKAETAAQLVYDPVITPGLNGQPAGLVASSEAELDRITAFIDSLHGQLPILGYQRNMVYLRFCHAGYDKGAALRELGRLLGISEEETFAVGDHYNDLSMLDGRAARHVACVANAIDPVKAAVRRADGYVAQAGYSLGVIEALQRLRWEDEATAKA